jgi:hypothetical protein
MIWGGRTSTETENPTITPGLDSVQEYFLERISRLEAMRNEYSGSMDRQQRRLLEHALYSTYWDCVNLGMRDEARESLGMPMSKAA